MLSKVKYGLLLSLGEGERYMGRVMITFKLKELDNLFLDFIGVRVFELIVNNHLVKDIDFKNHRITLPKAFLKDGGKNEVLIKFESEYVHNSAGLHKFTDPVD